MRPDDFSLQSNNGNSLKDLKDSKPEDITKNPKLQKFIKLFDFDGSGSIEVRNKNEQNEWQSIFTELKQAAVDDDLSNEEFGLYISKKMPNADLKLEDVNELLDIAGGQYNVSQIGDMTITRMNGIVSIKIKPNTTILAKNVNENGQFSDDDFIEMKTIDTEGKEITVKREELKTKEGTTQFIVVTRQDSKDESSTTIYGTSSYCMYEIFKDEEALKAMEFYRKGNNEYYVQYSQEGNTITHAKNGDTVDNLIKKFGFKDREEFDRLNPSLKGKKYPNVSDSIVVPGHYSAKDNKIVEQGTIYDEQYNYIITVSEAERRKFKEEHLQKLDENIFNKLNNLKGLELSNENIGLYFSLNSYSQKIQEYIFNIIENLAKEGKTADEIKTYFLSDPKAPKLTRKDGSKVNINLFNEFTVQMHDFVGTQADDTPQSVKGFIQDVMGLDITKGEGKELYDKLSKVGDPYVIMDINEMFSNIYHRTSKEYKDWHSKQVARLNSDGWKSDKSIKTTGEREYLKEYPPISKEIALEMYRAVINKMTAKKGETVTTKYDKFIEDNRDVYLREFAALTLFSLHQSGAGNLQGTAAQKDILNPSKYLLKPVGSFYDKKGKEIYEIMMADCYKGNKKFESVLKCYTTGYKQAEVPFDKAKMKHCMEVLQNPKSTKAQKKKALEDAFGYQVVNAAQDLIEVANFVDNVTDMALMIYGTGLIGKGLGKAVSFASKASTATRATAVITNTAKGISWGERLTQIGLSATNFAIWEGARYTVNYYTNDIEEDFSYGSGLGQRMAGGAAFGTFAGAWGQFVTQPMLKWIFKTPSQEAVTKEATAFVSKQLKGSSKFTSKEVLGAFNAGQQKAMTSLGKEAVGFASELTGFSIYEIGQKLIVGNDAQIRQILESSEKYTKESIDDLLKNPDELKKALKEAGCNDDVIRELTEINVGDVALGQLKTLLSFKAVGQLVYMHRAGKLPPSGLNFGKEKTLEFEPIKQNGKTMYKVKYPDGTTRTVADMNGVIALSNMHYQDVTLYKPIEQVLAKDGKMVLDEGITLQKNTQGYSVTFKDGTKVEAKDLKEVMGKAQAEYTIMGYETELAQKGQIELPDKQVVTLDRENNVYKTTMEGGIEVEAPSFKELLQTVQKKTVCQSIEKTFTDDKKAVMLDESTVIVRQEDGTYLMIVIEDGFPKEYTGKSVEEVLDKSAGVNAGVNRGATTEPQEKVTPQGMNAEEDVLIQKVRKENPATVIEGKVREKWQQHDIETPAPETDEPAIIFKDGKAVINEDLARRQLEEPAQVVSDEVTSLIFKGKLNEHLAQRYEEMGKVFEEIAKKRSADIKELVKQNPKNKQAVADGIVKILAQELGMEGFEPPILFEDTNGADGYADWPNGRIVINKNITNVKKLTSMISHEFVHMLQFRDVLAQYGEQGLRDLIGNDKSVPENEKESHIQKALNNSYNQHLLQSYDFQKAQTGTVEDYLRRIYKDEFTNTVGTDSMPEYVNQATERGAYSSQEKIDRGLDNGIEELNIGEIGLSQAELVQQRLAKMRKSIGGNKVNQDTSVESLSNETSIPKEVVEIDEFGQVHRKEVPAGISTMTDAEFATKGRELCRRSDGTESTAARALLEAVKNSDLSNNSYDVNHFKLDDFKDMSRDYKGNLYSEEMLGYAKEIVESIPKGKDEYLIEGTDFSIRSIIMFQLKYAKPEAKRQIVDATKQLMSNPNVRNSVVEDIIKACTEGDSNDGYTFNQKAFDTIDKLLLKQEVNGYEQYPIKNREFTQDFIYSLMVAEIAKNAIRYETDANGKQIKYFDDIGFKIGMAQPAADPGRSYVHYDITKDRNTEEIDLHDRTDILQSYIIKKVEDEVFDLDKTSILKEDAKKLRELCMVDGKLDVQNCFAVDYMRNSLGLYSGNIINYLENYKNQNGILDTSMLRLIKDYESRIFSDVYYENQLLGSPEYRKTVDTNKSSQAILYGRGGLIYDKNGYVDKNIVDLLPNCSSMIVSLGRENFITDGRYDIEKIKAEKEKVDNFQKRIENIGVGGNQPEYATKAMESAILNLYKISNDKPEILDEAVSLLNQIENFDLNSNYYQNGRGFALMQAKNIEELRTFANMPSDLYKVLCKHEQLKYYLNEAPIDEFFKTHILNNLTSEEKVVLENNGFYFDYINEAENNRFNRKSNISQQSQIQFEQTIETLDKILGTADVSRGIDLEYTKEQFDKDILNVIKDLPESQANNLLNLYGLSSNNGRIEGVICKPQSNIPKNYLQVVQKIEQYIDKFQHNKVTTQDPALNSLYTALTANFPEFAMLVGKVGEDGQRVDTTILKQMQTLINNPQYKTLSSKEQKMVKLVLMFRGFSEIDSNPDVIRKTFMIDNDGLRFDVTNKRYKNSEYTAAILERFNLTEAEKYALGDLVAHSGWSKEYNGGIVDRKIAVDVADDTKYAPSLQPENNVKKVAVNNRFGTLKLSKLIEDVINPDNNVDIHAIEQMQKQVYQNMQVVNSVTSKDLEPYWETQIIDGVECQVIDLRKTKLPDDFYLMGHFTQHGVDKLYNLLSNNNDKTFFSNSLIKPSSAKTFAGRTEGIISEFDNRNVAETSGMNIDSGFGKSYNTFVTTMAGKGCREVASHVKEKLNLTNEEYGLLMEQIVDKRLSELDEYYNIGGRYLSKQEIVNAHNEAYESMLKTQGEQNEITILNQKPIAYTYSASKTYQGLCPFDMKNNPLKKVIIFP